jgi:hypothetical protein
MARWSPALAVLLLPACGVDTLVDVASESAALLAAQCDAQASNAAVDTCFETFRTCVAQSGAIEADCRAALDGCLPERLPRRGPPPGHGDRDGGCRGGDEGRPEGGPPGGLFGPPPGDRPDGGARGPGGRRPHGRGQGSHRGPIGLDDAAVQACQSTAQACIAAGTAEQTCRDTARTCVHDAMSAAFSDRCQELEAACAANAGQDCAAITERCSAGLREPPPAGTCEAP